MPAPIQIGRYVLHDEIAAGGMASVHFGRLVGPAGFSKTVAIKRLHRRFAREPAFRKMILEEGKLAARIRHPNVVPPLDVLAEGAELLLVMEYVHGESLSKLLRAALQQNERVPLAIAAAIFANVLHGLHAAHEAKDEAGEPLGIVHRDVSPQNILVGIDGQARVIDFGIAKAATSGESTSTGTIKGKVPYLAPEQLEGDPATRRTDVWAAAVCFWEVLVGKRLFDGGDDSEILRQILDMPVRTPSSFNGAVPRDVDDIVLRALERAPEKRFATAREMAVAIESAVHLATATVVGAWAERLAATRLGERAAMLAQVEQTPVEFATQHVAHAAPALAASPLPQLPSTLPPPATERMEIEDETMQLPSPRMLPARSPVSGSPSASPAASAYASRAAPQTPRSPATAYAPRVEVVVGPPPMDYGPPPTRGAFGARLATDARLAPMPPSSAPGFDRPPAAGVLRKPELEIPNVDWLPPPSADASFEQARRDKAAPGRRILGWLAVLAVLALVGSWIGAPFLVRHAIVRAAAREGVTITIERVELSRRAVRLFDVRVESPELPGIAASATSATIDLKRYSPEHLTVDDLVLEVNGSVVQVASSVDAWRTAHAAGVHEIFADYTQLAIGSARVDWKNPVGPGSSLALENVALDMAKNGARLFGDDWHLSAPLVRLGAGVLNAGPWQLDAERGGVVTHATLRFDTSGTSPASVTFVASDDGAVSLSFAVPATPLAELHLPAAMLGTFATDRSRVEARGEVSVVTAEQPGGKLGRQATGHVSLAGGSLAVFPGGQAVDVALDLPFAGDPTQPIPVTNATFGVAPADPSGVASTAVASARLVGKVDFAHGPRIDLAGTTSALACAKPPGQTALAVQIALGAGGGAEQTKLGFTPSAACAPRLRASP